MCRELSLCFECRLWRQSSWMTSDTHTLRPTQTHTQTHTHTHTHICSPPCVHASPFLQKQTSTHDYLDTDVQRHAHTGAKTQTRAMTRTHTHGCKDRQTYTVCHRWDFSDLIQIKKKLDFLSPSDGIHHTATTQEVIWFMGPWGPWLRHASVYCISWSAFT